MQKTVSSLLSERSKILLLCVGILLAPFYLFGQGCDCPPVTTCGACDGGLTRITLEYTGSGIPVLVTAVDGSGQSVPGGLGALSNIINITSHDPANAAFRNGSVTVTITALLGGILASRTITTSCGVPIFEGSVFGNLKIISGTSLNGGTLCCSPTTQDNVAPTFTDPCPSNIQLFTAPGMCTASTSWDPPDATDNCGPITPVGTHNAAGTTFPVGITTVTYVATDDYNNKATCSFTVEVIDNIAPAFTSCLAAAALVDVGPTCVYTVEDFTGLYPTTDNCPGVTVTQSPLPGTTLTGLGTMHPITLTARDASGNTSTCTFDVFLEDNSPPVFTTCPSAANVFVDATCSYTVTNFAAIAGVDNCDANVTITQSPAVGTVLSGLGTVQQITLTATDDAGKTATCTFDITLADDTPPQFTTCPTPANVLVDATCSYTVTNFNQFRRKRDRH
jgi:large repetitive protein